MAFCRQCGTQFEDGTRFCPSCGASVSPRTEGAYRTAPSYTPPVVSDAQRKDDTRDAQNNKTMGILAYIGILVLVPIFAAKNSGFARFHANQGLVLLILEAATGILMAILMTIMTASFNLTGITIIGLITWLLYIPIVIFAVLGIVAAAKGDKKPLPIIGNIRILK